MASLATVYNRILGSRVASVEVENVAANADDEFVLRAIPNEEIYFFVKDIDNARVVRQADPKARETCWRVILSGGLAVLLLIGVLLPSAAGRIAGYQLEALRIEQQRLLAEKNALEIDEARLLSPERLDEIARKLALVDPAPQRIIYLDAKRGALAMNVNK
jgi:cell division protein FtsL